MAIIPNSANKEINIETQQRKKTEQMTYLLILIVIVAVVVLYFGTRGPSSPPAKTAVSPADAAQAAQDDRIFDGLRKTDLENTVFKDKKFEALTQNGEFPISIGQRGRENPFAAY